MLGQKKEIEKLRQANGELVAQNASLQKSVQDLEHRLSELENRFVSVEKSYGPLFDFFLRESDSNDPRSPDFFQPEHIIHPNGDYKE